MTGHRLQTAERQKLALGLINERGLVTVQELARACNVSDMTIRRDLDALAERQMVERTHGGAAAPGYLGGASVDLVEPELSARSMLNLDLKQRIARTAAAMVRDGQTVALDIGSTTGALAALLADRQLNVYATSLRIAVQFAQKTASIYVPPGKILGTEPSITGAQAVRYLEKLSFDIAFIGVSGMSDRGFFDYSVEDSEIKQVLIANSRRRVVLLDSSKFNRMSVVRVSAFEGIDTLITDAEPPESLRQALDAAQVETRIAL